MEILEFLLSFLANEYAGGKYEPIYKALKDTDFNFSEMLKKLDISALSPVIEEVGKIFSTKKPQETSCGLEPIIPVADKAIVSGLNEYLS